MNAKQIEELKKRHKETQFLQVDCALASIDLNSLHHLRALVWHVFNSLRVQTHTITTNHKHMLTIWVALQPTEMIVEDARTVRKSLIKGSGSGSKMVVLHAHFGSAWNQVTQQTKCTLGCYTMNDSSNNNSVTHHLALEFVIEKQYCEESRVYNCDSRSGELEKVLAAHNVSQLTSVYLVTDLRHIYSQTQTTGPSKRHFQLIGGCVCVW